MGNESRVSLAVYLLISTRELHCLSMLVTGALERTTLITVYNTSAGVVCDVNFGLINNSSSNKHRPSTILSPTRSRYSHQISPVTQLKVAFRFPTTEKFQQSQNGHTDNSSLLSFIHSTMSDGTR